MNPRGCSSAGRALRSQRRSRRFESAHLHRRSASPAGSGGSDHGLHDSTRWVHQRAGTCSTDPTAPSCWHTSTGAAAVRRHRLFALGWCVCPPPRAASRNDRLNRVCSEPARFEPLGVLGIGSAGHTRSSARARRGVVLKEVAISFVGRPLETSMGAGGAVSPNIDMEGNSEHSGLRRSRLPGATIRSASYASRRSRLPYRGTS